MSDFDRCIYCLAEGCLDGTAEHHPSCPSSTGVFPVEQHDVDHDSVCCDCDAPFALGDFYAQATPGGSDLEVVYGMGLPRNLCVMVVCLGCQALREVRA